MFVPGFDEFELDLELAFKRDLPPFIDETLQVPLVEENVRCIPLKKNGVYLLYQNNQVVYVGKTDSKAGFQNRLLRHAGHIRHRKNLDPSSISYKAIAIPVFKNADLESILIEHYGAPWNKSGFGGNDPGKQRDTQEPAKFDTQYPIDIHIPLSFITQGVYSCKEVLKQLSVSLPYTFRYEKTLHQQELDAIVEIPRSHMTVQEILHVLFENLPDSTWQATILVGRVIVYRENREYPYSQEIIRS
jgi:hypothetical protein